MVTYTFSPFFREYGLSIREDYTNLGDDQLDEVVSEAINGNMRLGPESVRARLAASGVKVQRARVRASMERLYPEGFAQRASVAMVRRTYHVAGPNSLWHIDGNMKLKR